MPPLSSAKKPRTRSPGPVSCSKKTRLGLRKAALSIYTAVPLARLAVRVAEAQLAYAELADRAADIRYLKGAIGPTERTRASMAKAKAKADLEKARAQLALALSTLTHYGDFKAESIPELAIAKSRSISVHPDYQLAVLELRAAERSYQAALGPDTSRIDRERRKAELEAARKALASEKAILQDALDQKEEAWREAQRNVELKKLALEAKQKNLAVIRLRFSKGVASELDVKNAIIETAIAELALAQAQDALARAILDLLPFEEVGKP